MTNVRTTIEKELDQYYHTPAAIQQVALDYLEAATNGEIDIVDPSNPFMFLLEASAVNTHTGIVKGEAVARQLYPLLATEYSDLYHHMSDVDYLDRFASPGRTVFTVVIPLASFKQHAITNTLSGVKKLTIPRDTQFTVGGYYWYTHTPIDVVMAQNGVVQVYYDLSAKSPLVNNETNILEYTIINNAGIDEIVIRIPVEQIQVSTSSLPVSSSTGFNTTIPYVDSFYYVRAYQKYDSTSDWEEIIVTHSDQVYDAGRTTLRATVTPGVIKLQLPEIYLSTGNVGETIRVDVFTTKGVISVNLADYAPSDFTGKWQDIGNPKNVYITPLININDITVFAMDPAITGRKELSFDDLRDRVIYRGGESRASITFKELSFQLSDRGYTLTKGKDTVTERQYICSRALPVPTGTKVSTPIGVRHGRTVIDTARTDITNSVNNNGIRKTITNRALFKEYNGTVNLVSDVDINRINAMDNDALAIELNNNKYYRTPFIYILDPADDLYSIRAYHISAPKEVTRSFITNNSALSYAVNTKYISVTRIGDTFRVIFEAEGPTGLVNIGAQLMYTDATGKVYIMNAYQQPLTDKTFTITFDLETTLDVSTDKRIEISNFLGQTNIEESAYLDLISNFDIYYFKVDDDEPASLFDSEFDRSIFTNRVVGVTHEVCQIKFGDELTHFHTRARAVIVPPVFAKYTEAVPMTYDKCVYARDSEGVPIWTTNATTGKPEFTVLHHKGDTVLDENGEVVNKHNIGDIILDNAGYPTVEEDERLIWEIEPFLLDAKYYYATSSGAVAYRSSIPDIVLGYLSQDIDSLSGSLMARTELVFQPTASVGSVPVNVDGKETIMMDTALRFNVNYMLEPGAYEDSALRKGLISYTKEVIIETLEKPPFALSELVTKLRTNGGDYIVDVAVENPIGGYNVGILLPENTKFSIVADLVPLSNGTMDIVDAVNVTFVRKVEA